MKKLKELLQTALDQKLVSHVDILPQLRELPGGPFEALDLMSTLDNDMGYKAFKGEIPNLKTIIGCYIGNHRLTPILSDAEPDWMVGSYSITPDTTIEDLMTAIRVFMLSDCSGCCNALEAMTLTNSGLFTYGNVSQTYHS